MGAGATGKPCAGLIEMKRTYLAGLFIAAIEQALQAA